MAGVLLFGKERLLLCILIFALGGFSLQRLRAQEPGTIDPSFQAGPGFLAVNQAALQTDGKLIISGGFTSYGAIAITNLARLNSNDTLDPSFNPGTGLSGAVLVVPGFLTNVSPPAIYSLKLQPDGKLLVGGDFVSANGVPRTNLVRFNPTGSVDTGLASSPDGAIRCVLPVESGKLLVGGAFKRIGGVERKGWARLNGDGSLDTSLNPNWGTMLPSTILCLAQQKDGKILVGGFIAVLNGISLSAKALVRFNADGTLDPTLTPVAVPFLTQSIGNILVQSDGKILVAGGFGQLNGVAHQSIARLNSDGSLDSSWIGGGVGDNSTYGVNAMALDATGNAFIGGNFTTYNGTRQTGIAHLKADGSLDSSFKNPPGSSSFTVNSLAVQPDGKLLVIGSFTLGNSLDSITSVLRLNAEAANSGSGPVITLQPASQEVEAGATVIFSVEANSPTPVSYQWRHDGVDLPGATQPTLTVTNVKQQDGGQYSVRIANAAGFITSQGALLNPIAPGWPDLSYSGGGTDEASASKVNSIFVFNDGQALLAGSFVQLDGFPRNRVARLRADGTVDVTFDRSTSATVELFGVAAQSNGQPIIVGNLSFPNDNVAAYGIGRLNLNGSLDKTFDTGIGAADQVFALAVQRDDKVIIGGFFGSVNGVVRHGIARLNAGGGVDLGFNSTLPFIQVISAILVQPDGKILVGGKTGGGAGAPVRNIARLNADGQVDTSFTSGASPNGQVRCIVLQPDGKILVGGDFTEVAGVPRNGVARLAADGGLDLAFDPGPASLPTQAFIYSLAYQTDGRVVIGGAFTEFGGQSRRNLARLNPNGSLDPTFHPGAGPNNAEVRAVALLPDGKILVGGDFSTFSGVPHNRIIRLHGGGPPPTGSGPALQAMFANQVLQLSWPAGFTLQSRASLSAGIWMDVEANSPQNVRTSSPQSFYRLIQR